ncbi:cysteine desulfurase-like protein [Nocardiopsis coralliicola]
MAFDVAAIRSRVPALAAGIAHFDGPGGTQMPQPVIDAMAAALSQPLSNRGSTTPGERNADALVAGARQAMADLLGAAPEAVVFGRSATQLTYDLSRALAAGWGPGDEVVVTRLDHDANVRPWVQAAERAGATVRWADFDPATGALTPGHVRAVLSDRTRLVAVTASSNLLGTRPDLAAIAADVHARGALFHVDGVHAAAHTLIDLDAIGADLFTCSPYKFLGPHLGVAAARTGVLDRLHPDKLLPSPGTVPERFELGTLPYELLAGTRAAVDELASLDPAAAGSRRDRLRAGFAALEGHEAALTARIEEALAGLDGVIVRSRAPERTPTLLLEFTGRPAAEAALFLAERGVHAPAGAFYAVEASRRLGLGDTGGLRIGIAPYTDAADVDRLLTGLEDFLAG